MTRRVKITALEVLEKLMETEQITAGKLSEELNCHPATVRSRVKELREDGEAIVFNREGYMHVTKEDIETDRKAAQTTADTLNWTVGVFNGLFPIGQPVKKLLPAVKRALKNDLEPAARKSLAKSCMLLAWIVQSIEQSDEEV